LRILTGELPGIKRKRWREIVQACGRQVVAFEVIDE
jgi:hypothetical protein